MDTINHYLGDTTMTDKMTIDATQFNKLRATSKGGNWKQDIVNYLIKNQGVQELKLYNDTRPDRLDLPENKKKHNLASQYTYLRDEGYLVQKEDDKVFLLTKPSKEAGRFEAIPGMESRLKALL
jgi:hypothetical protein